MKRVVRVGISAHKKNCPRDTSLIIHRVKVHIPVNNKLQQKFGHTRLLPPAIFWPFSTGLHTSSDGGKIPFFFYFSSGPPPPRSIMVDPLVHRMSNLSNRWNFVIFRVCTSLNKYGIKRPCIPWINYIFFLAFRPSMIAPPSTMHVQLTWWLKSLRACRYGIFADMPILDIWAG